MAQSGQRIFGILHPESELDNHGLTFSDTCLEFSSDRKVRAERLNFLFDAVLGPGVSQEAVFERIGSSAVFAALERFQSSTVIALGGSGSGKTFAVTGGAKHFDDRGLIPRSITLLFETLSTRPDSDEYEVAVSFYELYKENVQDLLSDRRRKVAAPEGPHGVGLWGLLRLPVQNEGDAYHALFRGDSNRHFEKLPTNPETSRSHVFFELHLHHRPTGRAAVLSFVDLAAPVGERCTATFALATGLHALKAVCTALPAGNAPDASTSELPRLLLPLLDPRDGCLQASIVCTMKFKETEVTEILEWLDMGYVLLQAAKSRLTAVTPSLSGLASSNEAQPQRDTSCETFHAEAPDPTEHSDGKKQVEPARAPGSVPAAKQWLSSSYVSAATPHGVRRLVAECSPSQRHASLNPSATFETTGGSELCTPVATLRGGEILKANEPGTGAEVSVHDEGSEEELLCSKSFFISKHSSTVSEGPRLLSAGEAIEAAEDCPTAPELAASSQAKSRHASGTLLGPLLSKQARSCDRPISTVTCSQASTGEEPEAHVAFHTASSSRPSCQAPRLCQLVAPARVLEPDGLEMLDAAGAVATRTERLLPTGSRSVGPPASHLGWATPSAAAFTSRANIYQAPPMAQVQTLYQQPQVVQGFRSQQMPQHSWTPAHRSPQRFHSQPCPSHPQQLKIISGGPHAQFVPTVHCAPPLPSVPLIPVPLVAWVPATAVRGLGTFPHRERSHVPAHIAHTAHTLPHWAASPTPSYVSTPVSPLHSEALKLPTSPRPAMCFQLPAQAVRVTVPAAPSTCVPSQPGFRER